MDRPKHIIPQVREEQPGLIDLLLSKFFLVRKPLKDQVDQSRNLCSHQQVLPITSSGHKATNDRQDQKSNCESMPCQSESDGAPDRAADRNASERGGREFAVWKTGGIGRSVG